MLLLRRRFPPNRGLWAIPGGLVELGESVREAVIREVKEETGLDVELEGILDVATDIHRDRAGRIRYQYVLVDYVARHSGGVVLPNAESTAWGWFSRSESEHLKMSKNTRGAVRKYFENFFGTSARPLRGKRSSQG